MGLKLKVYGLILRQDVVSYRVKQLEPALELEQVASPYSK
jgi:hypothetical protein